MYKSKMCKREMYKSIKENKILLEKVEDNMKVRLYELRMSLILLMPVI